MKFNIVLPEGVPPTMAAVYAQEAHRQAVARQEVEQQKREAKRERQEQIKQTLETLDRERVEREKREGEERRKLSAERFENSLRETFFAANPGAEESDWQRNRKAVIDTAMQERALGRGAVDIEKQRLLRSGRYEGL